MATLSLTLNARARAGVSLVSQNGRRWTFPAIPPEADHEFPRVLFDEISRPDTNPVNVAKGQSLHKITFNWLLAYPDDRSIEPDLQELRGFASDGKWFTINYTPSWGGWWLIDDFKVSQKMLNTNNDITQATVTLTVKRAQQIALELAPVKASSSTDIPIVKQVEVAGTSVNNPAQIPFKPGDGQINVGAGTDAPPAVSTPPVTTLGGHVRFN